MNWNYFLVTLVIDILKFGQNVSASLFAFIVFRKQSINTELAFKLSDLYKFSDLQKRTAKCFERLINMSSISSVTSSISSLSTWWISHSSTFSSTFRSPWHDENGKYFSTGKEWTTDDCVLITFVNWWNTIFEINQTRYGIDTVFFGFFWIADFHKRYSLYEWKKKICLISNIIENRWLIYLLIAFVVNVLKFSNNRRRFTVLFIV